MMNLAPSFGRKLNPDGLSPLDLALLNNRYDTVKRLVSFDGELVRVKGKERLTPLHHAAKSDDKIGCLVEFLLACPASIEDLTIHNENALDIARKSSSGAEAFKILYEWVSRGCDKQLRRQLLRKKDADGNSAETYHMKQQPKDGNSFHVKAEEPSLDGADVDTKNLCRYLRAPEPCYESAVRRCLQFMLWRQRDLTMEMRNVMLVVAVLIATASFQAIIAPPGSEGGGEASHNNNSSSQHMNNSFVYNAFNETSYNGTKPGVGEDFFSGYYFLNTIAFTASVGLIIMVLQLRSYTSVIHLSLIFMLACYWSALKRILPVSPFVALIYYIGTSVYILFVYYLKTLFWTMEGREPDFLAILLFSRSLKDKFRCLDQMGAFTLK